MHRFVAVMLLIVGVIHLLPVSGVLGPERLSALYGVSVADPDLAILMRHRAVLFGLLGVFIVYAAFRATLRPLALVAGLVSVVSFLWLARSTPGYNAWLQRVVVIDIVALLCLASAAGALALARYQGRTRF